MKARLLPDDPAVAEMLVALENTVNSLRGALRRAVEERDYWRARAMKWDADYQDGLGEYLRDAKIDKEAE